MPITPLPTPVPTRDDPANFAARGDAFLAALPTFATEMNAEAAAVNANAVSAATSAATATAAEQAATAAAGASIWVSGTTYAVGNVRFDPVNFLSYRRTTAGAGTTRPGLDATNWTQVAGTGNVTLNGGPLAGLRNLVINGNFSINQRGYVSGTATSGANQYTLDRWRVVTSGQSATFTASGAGNLVTAPAGGLEQVIEGASIAGGTYVINWTGTATCTVGGTSQAKGATFTLTAGANTTVRFSGGTVGDVQVEPGTVVTVFEARPVGLELMLCMRFFQLVDLGWRGQATSGATTGEAVVNLPVPMRAAPSVTGSTTSAVSFPSGAVTYAGITAYSLRASLVANANSTDAVWRATATCASEL